MCVQYSWIQSNESKIESYIKRSKQRSFALATRRNVVQNYRDVFWSHYFSSISMIENNTFQLRNYENVDMQHNVTNHSEVAFDIRMRFGNGYGDLFSEIANLDGKHASIEDDEEFEYMMRKYKR